MSDVARLLAPDLMPTPEPGTMLGRYRLGARIGAGGMAVVYEGHDVRLDRRVAIKILPFPLGGEAPDRIRRFQQEAHAASRLNHPNIVAIYDADVDQGCHYIAMEFVEGKTVREFAGPSGRPLDRKTTLDILAQTSSALSAAHSAGIVHRDIKPENIMVRADGIVKVLDFGLAKLRETGAVDGTGSAPLHTRPGQVAGTIQYLSPEQVSGRPVDARSDLFSLGVVAYELATGKRPFEGPTDGAIFDAILHSSPPVPSASRPGLGADFDQLVLEAIEKDPELRFQTANDFRSSCKRLSRDSTMGLPMAALPVQKKRTMPGWMPWSVSALMAACLGYFLYPKIGERQSTGPETLVNVTSYPGSEMYPSLSPDGRQIAFYWDGDNERNPGIYLKLVGEANPLRLTSGLDAYPAWLPDGNRILFARSGTSPGLYAISALGGPAKKISDIVASSQISSSPDGKWVAVATGDSKERGILLVPSIGGEVRRVTIQKAPDFDRAPAFSRTGHQLAFTSCTSIYACNLFVLDLDEAYRPKGSRREIGHVQASITGLSFSGDGKSIIYAASHSAAILPYLWQARVDGRDPPRRIEIAGSNSYSPAMAATGNRLVFQRDLGAEDIWQYRVGGESSPLIVSSVATNRNPQFSPDGTRIAFESSRADNVGEIWLAQADGSRAVQLTSHLGRHQGTPRWSPDGKWIAFDCEGQNGHWDIYAIEPSGSSLRRITFDPGDEAMPFWSRDGKWIYFRSDRTGTQEIWRVPFASGPPQQMTFAGGSVGYESMDGKTLFYTKGQMSGPLFGSPLAGGPESQLLDYVNFKAYQPSPDGIYYIGGRAEEGYYPLSFYRFATEKSELLLKIQGRAYQGLAVSPDRKTILFSKVGGLGSDLMMIENFQ